MAKLVHQTRLSRRSAVASARHSKGESQRTAAHNKAENNEEQLIRTAAGLVVRLHRDALKELEKH